MLTRQVTTMTSKVLDSILIQSQRKSTAVAARMMSSASPWSDYEMAPLDPIIGLTESYLADPFSQKVNVGVGAYRTDLGKPYVLPCVRKAEQKLVDAKLDMEYSGIVRIPKVLGETLADLPHDDADYSTKTCQMLKLKTIAFCCYIAISLFLELFFSILLIYKLSE